MGGLNIVLGVPPFWAVAASRTHLVFLDGWAILCPLLSIVGDFWGGGGGGGIFDCSVCGRWEMGDALLGLGARFRSKEVAKMVFRG